MFSDQQTLNINLLDNGLDFILKGIDEFFDDKFEFRDYIHPNEVSIRSYKYGSLHLFAGFLLLLKEKLYRYNPDLIFDRSKKRDKEQGQYRRPKTINYAVSKRLLKEHVKFSFSAEEEQIIEQVQDFRNDLEHYKADSIDVYSIWRTLSSFLRIIDKFLVQELQITVEDLPEALSVFNKVHHITSVLERMERQRQNEWYKEAKQRALKLQGIREQLQAEHSEDEDEEDYLDVYQEELILCPECYRETLIASGEYIGICLNNECEALNPVAECDRCGELTTGFPWELNFCDNCEDDIDYA